MVGMALIILPGDMLAWFGFTVDSLRFFSTQGGVFHIIMGIAYLLASREPNHERRLILFIISAKSIAFIFLGTYYLIGAMIPIIALSAISDGLMGLIVWGFFKHRDTNEIEIYD